MDPLSISVAALAFLQFGTTSIQTIVKIVKYTKGLPESQARKALSVERLTALATELSTYHSSQPHSTDDPQGRALYQLSLECLNVCQDLEGILARIQAVRGSSLISAVQIAWKAYMKESDVNALDERLRNLYQSILSNLIVLLRKQSAEGLRKLDKLSGQQAECLRTLLAANEASRDQSNAILHTLRNAVEDASAVIDAKHAQLIDLLHNLLVLSREVTSRKDLLRLLSFPEMNARKASIKDLSRRKKSSTFNWIYLPSHAQIPIGFSDWLEQPNADMFWITGRPGSGKSVMTELISQNEETRTRLKRWAGPFGLTLATHFFWSPGTSLQKTTIGLLRSLLFQLISSSSEAYEDAKSVLFVDGCHDSLGSWSWPFEDLFKALKMVIERLSSTTRLCFFLDGLDECDENPADLMWLVTNLRSASLKICVSSRPGLQFQNGLPTSTRNILELHEHTREDIGAYASERLRTNPDLQRLFFRTDDRIGLQDQSITKRQRCWKALLSNICRKAEGVFLWVTLVGMYAPTRHLAEKSRTQGGIDDADESLTSTSDSTVRLQGSHS